MFIFFKANIFSSGWQGQNEPQAGQSELREVSEGFRDRFGQDFRSIFKQRVATETLPTQIAGEGATRLLSRFWGGPRHSRLAPLGEPAARPLAVLAALAALALLAMLVCSLTSRASRSMIARFLFLGVFRCFFATPRFFENCNTLHTKTLFFEVRGVQKWSQNDPQNASKIELRCGGPPGEPPGAILEVFGGPKRLPRGSRERPGSAPGAPGGPK